jgi:predicted MFS family arabinose efflux permease
VPDAAPTDAVPDTVPAPAITSRVPAEVVRARVGVSIVFAVHGAVTGTFATRVPWLADRIHAGPGALGAALIAVSVGAILAMPLGARLAHQFSSRSTVRVLLLAWCVALLLPAIAPGYAGFVVALLVFGATAGMADVAMNAQGVVVEQRYGRSVMSGLHGLWSAGGLVSSAIGAVAAHANLDARVHFLAATVVLCAIGAFACRWLLDIRLPDDGAPAFALPSKEVLLVGLIGFCAVFAEGGSGDWCAVYLRTVTGAEPGLAAAAYTGFALAMTGGRLFGDRVIRRFGAVSTVRVSGVVAVAGAVLVVASRVPGLAMAGFALLGLGVAVVVPLCFAAAGTIGPNPARAIAGIATIAYGAGLAAPGAIGGVAAASSLPVSFGIVAALLVVLVFGAGALRSRGAKGSSRDLATISNP